MKRLNLVIFFILMACAEETLKDEKNNKDAMVFKSETMSLYKKDMRAQFEYPCKKINTSPLESIQQVPGSNYYFFTENIKKTSFTFKCKEKSIIYPVGMGIITDINRNGNNRIFDNKYFKHYFDRLISTLDFLPNDLKRILYKNYVIVDHGFYFAENYRLISVYTNLSNIPESLVIGSEVNYLTELGIINNDGFDILSLTLLNNEEGKLVAQDDIINIELYFQKDGNEFYLGQGVDISNNFLYFENLFK